MPGTLAFYPRLFIIHFPACWSFMYAMTQFGPLINVHAYDYFGRSKSHGELVGLAIMIHYYSRLLGLIIAFIISLKVSRHNRWPRWHSVSIVLFLYYLSLFDLNGWQHLKYILLVPGNLFEYPSAAYFLTNGFVLLSLSFLLFFSPGLNRFIGAWHFKTSLD